MTTSINSGFEQFTNKYSLSKTLRFELIPVGKTKEHFERDGLLAEDEQRASDYEQVKVIIDRYHKKFTSEVLASVTLDGLQDFADLYWKRDKNDADKNKIKEMQKRLRKSISDAFTKNPGYKKLFERELFTFLLPSIAQNDDEKKLISGFSKFTTYFTGFHENRKNMYSSEEESTAIAYRIVHDNLPKFLDNVAIFNVIRENVDISLLEKEMVSILNGQQLNDIFSISYFNTVLTQEGISLYNDFLGGRSEEHQTKIRGINEFVNNEHNQKQTDKNKKIAKLKPLYKQILSDRESSSFVLDNFKDDKEMLSEIEKFYSGLSNFKVENLVQSVFSRYQRLFDDMDSFDSSKVHVRQQSLSQLSSDLFGEWSVIKNALADQYHRDHLAGKKKVTATDIKKKEKWLNQEYFSIKDIEHALKNYSHDSIVPEKLPGLLLKHFSSVDVLIKNIFSNHADFKTLLTKDFSGSKLSSVDSDIDIVKNFLDSLMIFFHSMKPLHVDSDSIIEKDDRFYGVYSVLFDSVKKIIPLYNKARNHVTKKPYSLEKIKLNFKNSTLLAGWDKNKEKDNTSVILVKDGLYYLGIMTTENNNIFEEFPEEKSNNKKYKKMNYKLLPGPNKMLPKVFFSNEKRLHADEFTKKIIEKYDKGCHKKGDDFDLNFVHELIDFFKKSIAEHGDWDQAFDFKFSDTKSYKDMSGFYREVEAQGYRIKFQDISESYINTLVDEGKLYLFKIHNKDFSPHSKGTPNMHTLYWKALFDPENLKEVVYKLNGEAEVFYRKKSINPSVVHKKNEAIDNKNPLNTKKQSVFDYDIIKDKRFTVDKFQFHVPITLNFKASGKENLNSDVLAYLKNNPAVNIIGVDRGERHLLYVTMINQKGELLWQESLNDIINTYTDKTGTSQEQRTDYHALLDKKEDDRDESRKNWKSVENIKELKEGYISHVIHRIATLMVENNAILVMEDLNFGFKRGRIKVEKQVYQKFERRLIEKLNYLVFKDVNSGENGGLLRALQLSNKFESFKKLGKQSGFIFYVPSHYTSKMDPVTGFVDLLKPYYETKDKSRSFLGKFNKISYNSSKDWFEFDFDYKNFNDKAEGSKTDWIVCTTNHERFKRDGKQNNGKGGQVPVDVTKEFKSLFEEFSIPYAAGDDLKVKILLQDSPEFFKMFLRLLSVVLSLRHNNGKKGNDEKDYILSPVSPFFNSLDKKPGLPENADANGAFHVAMKGLWVLEKIHESNDLKKVDLKMTNKDWFSFVQRKR